MAIYRLPFENVAGWDVAVGNFDDPGGGHGLGQAFAWDFTFPVDGGAKVRAARAGTVIDARGDSDKVLQKGVDDVFWGPGNYVIIQHSDRTIAAYDHMQVDSLQVAAGQYVDQGAWLGRVGNTGSTSGGVVHLHFECHAWMVVGSTGPGSVVNSITGPSIMTHFEDANHYSWRPVVGDALSPQPIVSRQDGWRFCVRCGGLYLSYESVRNVCPAGGHHEFAGGGDYVLPNNATNPPGQAGWRHCHKCAGLFFSLNPGSKCPVKTPTDGHDVTGSGTYSVVLGVSNDGGQHGWRWCHKCQGMWFKDSPVSVCPADGGAHSQSGSGEYSIAVNPQDLQRNWRKCVRCRGLYLATNGPAACPAGAGGHSPGSSASYILIDDVTPVNTSGSVQQGWQSGWRYCHKCGQLWMGLNAGSHCPTGGGHSLSGSGEYWLRFNTSAQQAPGEASWRWCHKCQTLWSGEMGSHCPADGAAHSSTGSGDYALTPDGFLWHWCSKCQGLWLGSGNTGTCQAGGGHSLVDSSDYFVVCDYDPGAPPGSDDTQPSGWQEGWRYCSKCRLLWFSLNAGSHCPAGGAHVHGVQNGNWDKANFVLRFSPGGDDPPGRQSKWRWCSKCQTLWMGSNSGSLCAADGLAHSSTGSGNYRLEHSL